MSPGIDGYSDVGIKENDELRMRTAIHVMMMLFILSFPNSGRTKVKARR